MTISILSGQRLTAALLRSIIPGVAVKPAATSIANSAVLANDPDLAVPLAANSRYMFACGLYYTGAPTGNGGLNVGFSLPSGTSTTWAILCYASAGQLTGAPGWQVFTSPTASRTLVTNGSTAEPAWILGSVTTGATAGNLQLQWAQSAAYATASVLMAGSFLAALQG